jgi:23S rRNA (uracil1939-C5)-methyltransferase
MSTITNANETSATPRCPHFGTCGGCQYQDIAYTEQLRIKRDQLAELLQQTKIDAPADITVHSAEPYEYRNRIRLRIERIEGVLRFGYNIRATTDFLPIVVCPISAPILVQTVEALLAITLTDRDAEFWLNATAEIELFTNHDLSRVQLTLFCAPRTKVPQGSLIRVLNALKLVQPQVVGITAAAFDQRTGPTGRTLAEAGTTGLAYRVADIDYWITRGSFFQIDRFLLEDLVRLVCKDYAGDLAWDLFSGVGLFSRVLASTFTHVTAVESNATALADLRSALTKLGAKHTAAESTSLDFLRTAVLQRERPELVILDPPRAGAGIEACELLNRIAPQAIVYVSCDPATLARDLAVLQTQYTIAELHLLDLFPQTSHLETVVHLHRRS